jgi:hypothetical protein
MSSEETTLPVWLENSEHVKDISWLHKEQIIMLIQFATAWRTPDKIAKALGLSGENYLRFLNELNDSNSSLRAIVDFARLKNAGEINANAALRAKESSSGLKAYNELIDKEKINELKEAIVPSIDTEERVVYKNAVHDELSMFTELQDFFLNATETDNIPEKLKEYWQKLNIVHDILSSFQFRSRGRKYCMRIIQKKLGCKERYAYRLINESIQFFNIQESKTSWYNRLLEDLDKIKSICWSTNNFQVFIDAIQTQTKILHDMKDHQDIPPEVYKERVIITSHNPEEFGISSVDRKELMKMIKNWKITKEEKLKLKQEISIEEDNEDNTEKDIS